MLWPVVQMPPNIAHFTLPSHHLSQSISGTIIQLNERSNTILIPSDSLPSVGSVAHVSCPIWSRSQLSSSTIWWILIAAWSVSCLLVLSLLKGVKTISCYHGYPSCSDHVPTIYISQSTLVLNIEAAFYFLLSFIYQTLVSEKNCEEV